MKKLLALVFWFFGLTLFAQHQVNQYQYVIVPSKFSFTNKPDEYRLNTLTKLLLEKYGFKAFLDTDPIPEKIQNSKCENLYVDVISSGSFIMTKMQVILKDCQNKTIYQSAIGKSKEKEYRVAYTQSLRQAFDSFETLHYQYEPKSNPVKVETPITGNTITETPENSPSPLYAQSIPNGFQLVDATPKVVMKIFKTSNPNTFTAVKGSVQGVLISKNNEWFFERYENDQFVSEKVSIKF